MESSLSFFDLPNEDLERLEDLCSEFERQLQLRDNPSLDGFVTDELDASSKLYLLSVMIPMELGYRGQYATYDAYLQYMETYPQLRELIEQVFAREDLTHICEDSQKTIRSGQTMDPELKLWPGEEVDDRYRIVSLLGSGSFGVVYRAHDKDLKRDVALKVAHNDSSQAQAMQQSFLAEAQSSASLKADGIATIYDLFNEGNRVFIVQEFVHGRTLHQVLASHQYDIDRAVSLVVKIARAIRHAHACDTYHRDLKPGNVIIDANGQPTIVDFGLATNTARGTAMSSVICGTPNYMSPEQVRGEVNRTDAQSDLWSIGVILYEFMAGVRPFDASETSEVFERIKLSRPRSLQDLNSEVPAELERIVMKCLAKKKRERYANVDELILDLERFQRAKSDLHESKRIAKIIPKGLRPFSYEDSEFFLQMLPGPRDFQGIPESVLFWKNKIENQGAFEVFPVGLIYGASGCGKSSFVKAGLLPVLADNIHAIYIESTRRDTELRLLKALKARFNRIPPEASLPDAFAMIRDDGFLEEGEKLLVVIDQFEQWLAFNKGQSETQLLNAIRHCEGATIQCLLMIRQDYWPQAGEFMDQLEVPLVQNENCRAVELFDCSHARDLLEKFGRAYGKFTGELTEEQSHFLDDAIDELSENGRVVGARLSLFVEALANQDWTKESLGNIGGADGVGVVYLNNTFVDAAASPKYRSHCQAAQACLAALLPESGSNLKGHMLSRSELLAISGYSSDGDFQQLLDILDKELRLVSNTSPAGSELAGSTDPAIENHFQLSHDYLVPILRRWIDSEQQRRFRGRVQARMSQVAAVWKEIGHQRYLPTMSETLSFIVFSRWKSWTPIQRQMMGASVRKHIPSFLICSLVLMLVIAGGGQFAKSLQQDRLVAQLLQMPVTDVASQLASSFPNDEPFIRKLRNNLGEIKARGTGESLLDRKTELQKLKLSIALAKLESTNWQGVLDGIDIVDRQEIPEIANVLAPRKSEYITLFKRHLESNSNWNDESTIRRAMTLAVWGDASYLMDAALEAGFNELEQYVGFLKCDPEFEQLALQKAKLVSARVPGLPSPSLRNRFSEMGGVVGLTGAVTFACGADDVEQTLRLAFAEGFVPVSFRPYLFKQDSRVAISWQRPFKYLAGEFDDWFETVSSSKRSEFENKILEWQKRGWVIQDVSCYQNQDLDWMFTALMKKNDDENYEQSFESNKSYDEFNRDLDKYCQDGFQVSRLFVRVDSIGQPRYSTLWDRTIGDGEISSLPSLCVPRIGYRDENENPHVGASYADCQLCLYGPGQRDWIYINQVARKRLGSANNPIQLPVGPIGVSKSSRFYTAILLLRWQNRLNEASLIAEKLLSDLPNWTEKTVEILKLYSLLSDTTRFEAELQRVSKLNLSPGTRDITVPVSQIRSAVSAGDLDRANDLFAELQQHLDNMIKKFDPKSAAVQTIQRAFGRTRLILASGYPRESDRRKQLTTDALEILHGCAREYDYKYMLADQDFDVVRSNQEFRRFLWERDYIIRTVCCWRVGKGINRMVESDSLSTLIQNSRRWLESGYQPRCHSCAFDPFQDSLYGRAIWEKRQNETEFRSNKRLANSGVLLKMVGHPRLLESINQGKFGQSVKSILPEKFKLEEIGLMSQ